MVLGSNPDLPMEAVGKIIKNFVPNFCDIRKKCQSFSLDNILLRLTHDDVTEH